MRNLPPVKFNTERQNQSQAGHWTFNRHLIDLKLKKKLLLCYKTPVEDQFKMQQVLEPNNFVFELPLIACIQ